MGTYLSQHLLLVDDEEAPEGDAVLPEHAVGACNLHTLVGQQRDVHGAQPSFAAGGVHPAEGAHVSESLG